MTDDQTVDECGICLETLTAAVILPCNHKFCASCLDGWKSKFGADYDKEERSKSCPLCRKRIPPSKEMIIQVEYLRKLKRDLEARGETFSEKYSTAVREMKLLEAEIGDYEVEGLDYDRCMELPKEIFKAVKKNNMKMVMKWLGSSPVDKKKLSARYPDFVNATLVHFAVGFDNSNLLSILLQYGADVNALDANGWNPLMAANQKMASGFEQAKILLEWGIEIILPRKVLHMQGEAGLSGRNREAFMQVISDQNTKLANLISSEFGGRRCEVINLPNHPQLNGKTCVVEKYITKKEKYKIIFEGSGNAALVGSNNLKRRDRTPLDCGYYITFKNRMSRREFATKEECQAYVTSLSCGDVKGTAEELESLKL